MASFLRKNLICLLLLTVAGGVLYSRTLHVPWLFDDIQNIVFNPLIRDLRLALSKVGESRGVAFLSFALNYRFGELDVVHFHIVNIAVHIAASWVVFLIARRFFRDSRYLPLTVALIFLAHPLQTQAVNYLVQRMASMCGLFFFLAIYFYIRARELLQQVRDSRSWGHLAFYALSAASYVLALWTKQNAVVLPLALLLVDRYALGMSGSWKRRLLYLLPFVLITGLNLFQQVGMDKIVLKEAGRAEYWAKAKETSATAKIVAPSKEISVVKPPENLQAIYFVTELSVLWLYIRLLFIPVNQVFDYGYPLVAAIVSPQNVAAFLGHALLVGLALYLRDRRPLASFGILWFYLSLVVESSIIPLDAAVEHRLYTTVFGFAIVLGDLLRMIPSKRVAATLGPVVIVVFMTLTWQRNAVWADTVAFARDNVRKAPSNQRNYLTLATAYADREQWADAEKTLREAIGVRPDHPVPYENLGSALARQGRFPEALECYRIALRLSPDNSFTLYNAGIVLIQMGDIPAAREVGRKLKPLNQSLSSQLELLLVRTGMGG